MNLKTVIDTYPDEGAVVSRMKRDDSILHELKQRTAFDHRRLETLVQAQRSLCSLPEYRVLLSDLFAIYLALETRMALVAALPHYLPDISNRWKISYLASDLRSLGIAAQNIKHCSPVPPIASVSQALGCMYVLEGSTLGGQILSREVLVHLKLTRANGCRFFSSYGSDVGSMWRRFTDALESYDRSNPNERPVILDSAVATFRFFYRHLSDKQVQTGTATQHAAPAYSSTTEPQG